MKVLNNSVLFTEHKMDQTTESGLVLSTKPSGSKPAVVIAVAEDVPLKPEQIVYLDWSKALPVELDGLQCGVVEYEHVKLVVSE